MEPPFDKLDGVISTTSGYIGGTVKDPTYKQVSRGGTGHAEAMQVIYDPERISYAELLDVFWHNIDPTRIDGQFCEVATSTAVKSSITMTNSNGWRCNRKPPSWN